MIMDSSEIQQELFKQIKRNIPENLSATEEIARILDVSPDSVYRRMRGEKTISLDEVQRLCAHYKISLDQLIGLETNAFIFEGNLLSSKTFNFEAWVTSIMQQMAYMNSFKKKEFYYICKDIPFFHHYYFKEIAAFKWFFWLKTYFHFPEFEKRKFKFSDYPDELFALDQKVLNIYNQMPSTEFWNIESMNIILRQIAFYLDGDVFESSGDAYILYELVGKIWDHLERQATLGYKFDYNDPDKKPMGEFKMYFNEVLLGDNNILVILDDVKASYITHTTINYMITRDVRFNENMYNHIQNTMKRSTLISKVSEKERSRFFRIVRDRLDRRKEALRG